MEDLITIVIIVIGVAIKLFGTFKKNAPKRESEESTVSWEEFLEEVENSGELKEMVQSDPELQKAYDAAQASRQAQAEAVARAQAERDAALLEQQRLIAEMAAQAQARNQSSMAEESSVIYQQEAENAESDSESNPADWAELIRNNRTEAVVISEILAPPAALR